MTDPTPEQPDIRDYEARIPIRQPIGRIEQLGDIVARFPAPSPIAARRFARYLATELGVRTDLDGVVVTDVDDTRSAAELAAGLDFHRRVLAALAAKFPMMLQLTDDEFTAADPDRLLTLPVADRTKVFLVLPAEQSSPEPDGGEPLLMPLNGDEALPAEHGGYTDPDVRYARIRFLTQAKPRELDVMVSGEWQRLNMATVDPRSGSAILDTTTGPIRTVGTDLVVVRPATSDGFGTDLVQAARLGHQVLRSDGWRTVEYAEYMGALAGTYKATFGKGSDAFNTTYNTGDKILTRATPPGWWA